MSPFFSGVNRGMYSSNSRASSKSGLKGGLKPGLKNLTLPAKKSTKPVRGLKTSTASLLGSQGMQLLYSGNADDDYVNVGNIGFDFPFYSGTYRTNIYVGSNSYITFGYGSTVYSGISASNPGRGLFLSATDRSYQQVFAKQDIPGESFRIRYEGSLGTSGTVGSSNLIWEVTLFVEGVIQIVFGLGPGSSNNFITDGSGSNALDFVMTNNSSGVLTRNGNGYIFTQGSYGFPDSSTPSSPTPTGNTPTGNSVQLNWVSNGDTNGVFYYLGTRRNTVSWRNPHGNAIQVDPSSFSNAATMPVSNLVDRATSTFATNDASNAWVVVDLRVGYSLLCSTYTIKGRGDGTNTDHPRNWKLQGSNSSNDNNEIYSGDNSLWTDIDTQSNNTSIGLSSWFKGDVNPTTSYRYFRLLQTGVNSSNRQILCFDEWELYGRLFLPS